MVFTETEIKYLKVQLPLLYPFCLYEGKSSYLKINYSLFFFVLGSML